MNIKNNNNSKTTPKRKINFICAKTKPEDGKPFNYFVKGINYDNNTSCHFFMDQQGKPLNSANESVWNGCLKKWNPKPEIGPLPENLIASATRIFDKVQYALQNNINVGVYAFGKKPETNKAQEIRKKAKALKKENDQKMANWRKDKLNVITTGSKRAPYNTITLAEVSH